MFDRKKIANMDFYKDLAEEMIKDCFLLQKEDKNISGFPGCAYPVLRMVMKFQEYVFCIVLECTNNDIVIKLFNTSVPEKFFLSKKDGGLTFDKSQHRSGKPYIFVVKYPILTLDETWVDTQQNIGKANLVEREVLKKMNVLAGAILEGFKKEEPEVVDFFEATEKFS